MDKKGKSMEKRKKMARKILDAWNPTWGLGEKSQKHILERPPKSAPGKSQPSTKFVEDGDVVENLATGKKLKVKMNGKEVQFIPMS